MRMVKCKQCGKIIDSNESIKVKIGKSNCYFCNEQEKENYINKTNYNNKLKLKCFSIVYDITKRSMPIVYKTINDLNNKYTLDEILEALTKVKYSIEKYYNEKYTTDFAFARYIETCINNIFSNPTEKKEKYKFKIINSRKLAITISYFTGQDFYELDDKYNEGQKCYSFVITEKLNNVLEDIEKLKSKYIE
jgi:hypothetical protein